MFLHNLVALVLVLPLFGHMPWISVAIIPAVAMIMLLSVPVCLLMGMICARYRDLQMLVTNFSNVFFLMTPIVWMPSTLPGARSAAYLAYNPFFYMVDLIRQPILNVVPPFQDWIVCGGMAVAAWGVCFLCLSAFRARIPFWV
jgi:lipopolysaccharide transport system permease protein